MRKTNSTILAAALVMFSCMSAWYVSAGDRRPTAATVEGVWDIEGIDELGTRWIGTMVLTGSGRSELTGYVDWIGDDGHCGREYLTARFDQTSRHLKLAGVSTKFADRIVKGNYSASLSGRGTQLRDGTWGSGVDRNGVPGHWSARRLLAK